LAPELKQLLVNVILLRQLYAMASKLFLHPGRVLLEQSLRFAEWDRLSFWM
jgi:hypothetical protein